MKPLQQTFKALYQDCKQHWDGALFLLLCTGLLGVIGAQLLPTPRVALVLDAPSPALLAELTHPPTPAMQGMPVASSQSTIAKPALEPITLAAVLESTGKTPEPTTLHPNKHGKHPYPIHPKKDAAHTPIVHLNSTNAVQLALLPGVGEKTAKLILDYRKQIGQFSQIEQIMDVKGIGKKKFAKMRPFLKL